MKRQGASSNGFTILEILITIIVIGILATITIFSYGSIQQGARDSTRDSHAAQLKIALEKYFADNSQFPAVCSGGDNVDCPAADLGAVLAPYLPTIPQDPRFGADPDANYRYIRGGTSGSAYGLRVSYENKAVCKSGINMLPSWWGAAPECML